MDKLSNQTKNLMKLTQELLVSEDAIVVFCRWKLWLGGEANEGMVS